MKEDSLWEGIGSETPYGRWRPSSSPRQFEATQHGRISASIGLRSPSGGIVSGHLAPPCTRPRRESRHTGNRRGRVARVLSTDLHTLLSSLKVRHPEHHLGVQALTLRNLRTPRKVRRNMLRLLLHGRTHLSRVRPRDPSGDIILPTRVSHTRSTLSLHVSCIPFMHSHERFNSAADLLRKIGDASAPTGSLTNSVTFGSSSALQPRRERRLRLGGKQRTGSGLLSRGKVFIVNNSLFAPLAIPSPIRTLRTPASSTPGTESRLRLRKPLHIYLGHFSEVHLSRWGVQHGSHRSSLQKIEQD